MSYRFIVCSSPKHRQSEAVVCSSVLWVERQGLSALALDALVIARLEELLCGPDVRQVINELLTYPPPGLAPLGRNDVKLAVRLEQHVVLGLAKHNPFAVRRIPRKEVAHPVERSPFKRLRLATFAPVKWYSVQIELERLALFEAFTAFIGAQKNSSRPADVLEPVCLGGGE